MPGVWAGRQNDSQTANCCCRYYPEALDKENQDAVCVYRRYGGDSEQLFFGVFDGHGQQGTSCAQFAKDTVGSKFSAIFSGTFVSCGRALTVGPPMQVPHLLLSSGSLSSDPITAFGEAMFACNEQLRSSAIDDSLSGTTAIACLVRGRAISVANVGDSRYVKSGSMTGIRVHGQCRFCGLPVNIHVPYCSQGCPC